MNIYFLTLQTTYHATIISLSKDNSILATLSLDNKQASKNLIITIDTVLAEQKLSLQDLKFIGVYQGPAPFTTLRTALATANGLAYASAIPLVGVNGLEVFAQEYAAHTNRYVLVLLNAFCNDVYYAWYDKTTNHLLTGSKNAAEYFKELSQLSITDQVVAVGNAVPLYTSELQTLFGNNLKLFDEVPQMASHEAVVARALQEYNNNNTHHQLLPLYLKAHSAQLC